MDKIQGEFRHFPKVLTGLDLSSEAYFLAKRARLEPGESFVRITKDLKEGLTLRQNLEFFLGETFSKPILFFPPHDSLPYTGIVPGSDITAERIATLQRLLGGGPSILITCWSAVLRKTIPPEVLRKCQWTLHLKEEIPRTTLVQWLISAGYRHEVVVESPGDFAVRGGLVDIFPLQEEYPLRLEFDGDELTQIRRFDPATQTTLKNVEHRTWNIEQITLIPASEILYEDPFIKTALRAIKKFAEALELPATLRREVAEKIEGKLDFTGKQTFLPAFYERSATLLDYISSETVVFAPDPALLKEEENKLRKEVEELYRSTKSVERLIPPSALFYTPSPFPPPTLRLPSTSLRTGRSGQARGGENILPSSPIISSAELKAQWSMPRLKEWQSQRFKIRLVCHTPIQAERLKDLLQNQGISLPVEIGNLSHGFGSPEEGLLILTEEEIFGHKTFRRTAKAKREIPYLSFGELQTDDYLVHEEHGVCRYKGLKHLIIRSTPGDFLDLEFLGGDKLFLPIYRLGVVQRYAGGTSSPPIDSLRGIRWKKLKERVRREIYKIASELLKIHAERELHPGIVYPAPDALDEEFASHFPFDETPDQAEAIEDVFRDMQNPKPMDRLICGDVGYGKTEVAMRAAFKAVGSGRQVAFLVPTTILALQHYENFLERFSKLAISVAMLSRFTPRKEQKETLEKLARGGVDIVIGTHRLLAEDVRFKDLGLLIIDEEHRFGVKHKERIKKLRPTVDVLTLSATPIPRTLHMSLIGLRDLSMIHTPPVDRLAIRTFMGKWEDALVKHAINQELARGGQVFFVHNRVATIGSMHKRLQNMFPDVSIAVAHGQMNEKDLEKVMIDFLHQKKQILLTTTIIESGIDVPSANTMIINRADLFGLSELYQLRGRVGRSDRQAQCYLLVPDEEMITAPARRRLSVLTRYTELGAGFQIASHDLEIRGAGNLLGASQSGFVDEIGYELYTKLLARTIRKLKGEKIEEEIDPEIQLGIAAFIPEEYVGDANLRMSFYKRMSHLNAEADFTSLEEELKDRFGPLPQPVKNLLGVVAIKQLAMKVRLKAFRYTQGFFSLEWPPSSPPRVEALVRLIQNDSKRYQLKPSGIFLVKELLTIDAGKNVLREAEGWTRD